jgi:hypothetical protein
MEILDKYQDAKLRVYAIWYKMYPGDERSKWDGSILPDSRVTHFWDEDRLVGRWMVDKGVVHYRGKIVWDAYLLFDRQAVWKEVPSPMIGWGMPVYLKLDKLRGELMPLLMSDSQLDLGDRSSRE